MQELMRADALRQPLLLSCDVYDYERGHSDRFLHFLSDYCSLRFVL